jgi:peptidoglycan/xylan/chitin deacetylase (PgdA/CDA1 family)
MIPVLMYHALEDRDHPSGITDPGERVYVLQVEQFAAQMGYLKDNGFRALSADELLSGGTREGRVVAITFDDGRESDFTLALPILQRHGFSACFFITTGWTGTHGYMSEEQIRGLADGGMTIGSHGVTHSYLEDLSEEQARCELDESRNRLIKISGQPVKFFSAPGGRIGKRQAELTAEAGYKAAFSSQLGALDPDRADFVIPRIAIKRGQSIEEFGKIAALDSAYLMKARLKKAGLDAGKKILGNAGYEKFRASILRIRSEG